VCAVVARSTFRSQNVQSTPAPDHFWKLRCRKSARCCGTKHISKSKCTKHTMLGPLLEVEMSKKCAPLWREAHFEVNMLKTPGVRTTCGRSDVVSRGRRKGLCTLSKVRKKGGFCSIFSHNHHYTTLHSNTHDNYNYTFTTFHYTTVHYTTLHPTTPHYTPLHYAQLHSTTLNYTQLHSTTTLHCTALHDTTRHYTTRHYTTLHYTTPHHTTLDYTTPRDTTLHYTTLHHTTLDYTTLRYTTLTTTTKTTTTTTTIHNITLHYNYNYTTLIALQHTTLHTTQHHTTLRYATLH